MGLRPPFVQDAGIPGWNRSPRLMARIHGLQTTSALASPLWTTIACTAIRATAR